ncbi:MAG: PAS domain S-box protein [Brevundimonas sp.]
MDSTDRARENPYLTGRRILLWLGLMILAVGVDAAAVLFTRETGRVAAIWPLNAIGLVILMRSGRRNWPAVLAALFLGNLGAYIALGDNAVRSILFSLGNFVEVGAAAYLLVRRYPVRLTRRSGVIRFLAAAVVACGLSSLFAAAGLSLSRGGPPVEGAVLWFSAHLLGLIVFAPLVLIISQGQAKPLFVRQEAPRSIALLGGLCVISTAAFVQTEYPLLFIAPVMVALVAFQLGLAGASLATLLVATIAIPLTLSGYGPVALVQGGVAERVLLLQAFLGLLSLMSLTLGAAVLERRALIRRLTKARIRAQARSLRERELLSHARLSEEMSNVGYWTLTPDTGVIFWSREVFRIHGVDPETFSPGLDDALSFYTEDDRAMITDLISERMATGQGWTFDAILIRKSDGDRRNVRSVAASETDASGRVVKIFGVFKDLTEERRMMSALVENERKYRLLADNATDVIATYNLDGTFTYLSPSIFDLLGYTPEELVGRKSFSIMAQGDAEKVIKTFAQAIKSDAGFSVEYRAVRKDGVIRWLEAHPRAQRDETGRIVDFVDSVRDVTERHHREAMLAQARREAETATGAKATFLANMSHEIRTPLNGVLGFAELLSSTPLQPEQAQYVSRIRAAGKGLATLIDDILDVSRIEAGKMPIERRAFDLRHLADEATNLVAAAWTGKPIAFSAEIDPAIAPQIDGDDTRIRQILLNLLGNAAKFTEAGQVRLAASVESGRLTVRIADTGPGIEPGQLAKLFEGFTQADDSITRRFGGTGLGLSISRSLAKLMDGDLIIESELGVGTTAVLTLPYRATEDGEAGNAAPPRAIVADDIKAAVGLKVMVVDDVELNRELVEIALGRAGHQTTAYSNAPDAIAALVDGAVIDLILMDVQMPIMDGLTATRRIRALPGKIAETPIVGLTANALPDQVAACRAAGMDEHVAKPIDVEALLKVVGAVVARCKPRTSSSSADGSTSHQADTALLDLSRRYAEHLKTIPAEIDRLMDLENPTPRAEGVAALAHSIAGTAGSLGFDVVSDAAFKLEASARHALVNPEQSGDLEESRNAMVAALRAVAAPPADEG